MTQQPPTNKELTARIAALEQEQAEALEREQAAAAVLRVISRTPGNLDAALQAIADAAVRLCNADGSRVTLLDGDFTIAGPCAGIPSAIPPGTRRRIPDYQQAVRQLLDAGHCVHLEDYQARAEQLGYPTESLEAGRAAGLRTQLIVPMMGAATRVGTLVLARMGEVRPFSDREIALAESFADQAVIAIENDRLFREMQGKNRELTAALDRQTASGEILRTISAAPGDLTAVFETILDSAHRLADATAGLICTFDGEQLHLAAGSNVPEGELARMAGARVPDPRFPAERAVLERRTIQVADLRAEIPAMVAERPWTESRSVLGVPVLRGGDVLGVVTFHRREVRPFTEEEVALLEAFADQAAIAIENARLFAELEESNASLREALEQQTATSEVLSIISRSPTDLDRVLRALAESAVRLTGSADARIWRLEDGELRWAIGFGRNWARPAFLDDDRMSLDSNVMMHRAVIERRVVQMADVLTDPAIRGERRHIRQAGHRTAVAVPLLREGNPIGVLLMARTEVLPYTDAQVALLRTFADQAVIAMENARLFQDLKEALEQQTATADVLRIISSTPTDLQRVLDAVAERAARLCEAERSVIRTVEDGVVCIAGAFNRPDVDGERPLNLGIVAHRAIIESRVLHVVGRPDEIAGEFPVTAEAADDDGVVNLLAVPLLREAAAIGVVTLQRRDERPYTDAQVGLVRTFADQAAIAIKNARLFEEVQTRTRELEERNAALTEALEHQRATGDVLEMISRSPSDLQVVLETIGRSAMVLCQAEQVSLFRVQDGRSISAYRYNPGPDWEEGTSRPVQPGSMIANAVLERRTVEFFGTPEDLARQFPRAPQREGWTLEGRLSVPLLARGEPLGAFVVTRSDRRFTPSEIALIETFAAQAVIAIENARLFEELQARTGEVEERNAQLMETLEYQQATNEVMELISRAPTDLQAVLDAIVERASRLLASPNASMAFFHGTSRHGVSTINNGRLRPDMRLATPLIDDEHVASGSIAAVVAREGRAVAVAGGAAAIRAQFPLVAQMHERIWAEGQQPSGSMVSVPLVRTGVVFGSLTVGRPAPDPYTVAQVTLLETFAAQAVIAIENARLFEEIQRRTSELEAASQAKSEFLSRMSHELRTPLNAIIGFAEIMELDQATTARQHERVRHILQGGRHLLGLINEVLDITRIEAGRLSLSPEPVRLDGVVQEVLDLERPLAADADVTFELDDPDAFRVAVQADRQRLRQVVLNLVANAVKYNRPGGRATLACGPGADGRVRLTVHDTGPGIPADQIGRLFAPFERLSADVSGIEGTGLGLAIARGLAEAMGGVIGVESVVGEGSAFWVELPVASIALALPEPQELARPAADEAPPATATVLYIEDNQPNVELVQHILEFRPGITLLTAPDGATGIRIAWRYRPDLILLDLNLPDLQGDEVLARLRADERTAAVPVLMISADATRDQIDRLVAAGARAYLTKPLDVKRLLALLDEFVASNAQRSGEEPANVRPRTAARARRSIAQRKPKN